MVNLIHIASKRWSEYTRGDLDVLAETMQETLGVCVEALEKKGMTEAVDVIKRAIDPH